MPSRGGLFEVRNLTHDGLFTASLGEENWGIAHRVLMPVFNGITIKNMFDGKQASLWIEKKKKKITLPD